MSVLGGGVRGACSRGLDVPPLRPHPVPSSPCLRDILEASLLFPTHTATILAPPGRGGLQHPPPDPLAFFSALWSVLPNASVVYPKN